MSHPPSKEKVNLTKKHVEFVMGATGIDNKQEAIQHFVDILSKEGIDVDNIVIIIDKLMKVQEFYSSF